jgi:ERCC4-type nuclease
MEIVVDDRERAVSPFFEDLSHSEHIQYSTKRLEVGDYAICYRNFIMIIIERKTWADLAASLRDGRKANIQKLIALRESTGCQIVYLIEGDPCIKQSKMVSRIPAKNLRAHIDHIAFRDGIHMIYAYDQQGSAERIFELARNYCSIKPSPFLDVDEIIGGDIDSSNQQLLTDKSINDAKTLSIQEQLLQCLPGVGSIVSNILAENDISLYTLYHETCSVEDVAILKYPTGGSIGLEKARKICAVKKLFMSESEKSKKIQIRILSTIPLISKATASTILENVTLASILDGTTSVEDLEKIHRSEKSMLGNKAASNIIAHLMPSEE